MKTKSTGGRPLAYSESQLLEAIWTCRSSVQAACLRDANRIPLELVAVYRCHIRSP
jgi:hypothetical protein